MEVYLAEGRVGIAASPGVAARWADSSSLDESWRLLADVLQPEAMAGVRRLRVWLSASLARPFLVPAATGARNQREALALATAMASDATGLDDAPRVWLDRWRGDAPTVAVAMPESVWQQLHAVMTSVGEAREGARRNARPLRLASVRPWWNLPVDDLLAQSRRNGSRIGWSLSDGEGVQHGLVDRGEIIETGFDHPAPHDTAASMLKRRLQASWGAGAVPRHLVFDPLAASPSASAHAIGAWRDDTGGAA